MFTHLVQYVQTVFKPYFSKKVTQTPVKLVPLTSRITVYTLPQWIYAFIKFGLGGGLVILGVFLGIPIPASILSKNLETPVNTHLPSTGYVVSTAGIRVHIHPKYPDTSSARRRLNARSSSGRDTNAFLDSTLEVRALNRFRSYPRPKVVTKYPSLRRPLDSILIRKNLTGKKVIFSNGLEALYSNSSPYELKVRGELYPNRLVGRIFRFPFRGSKRGSTADPKSLHIYNNYYKWIFQAILDGYDSCIESYRNTVSIDSKSKVIDQPMCNFTSKDSDQKLPNSSYQPLFQTIWEDTSEILAYLERLENPRLTDVRIFAHYELVLRIFGNLQSLLDLQGEVAAEKIFAIIKIIEAYQTLLELLITKVINPCDVVTLQAFAAHAQMCKSSLETTYSACPNRTDGPFTIRQFADARGYLVYVDLIPRTMAPSIDKLSSLSEDENQ